MMRRMLMLAALGLTVVFLAGAVVYAAQIWVRLTPPKSSPILMLIKA
jgi:hypothetical protein